MIPTCMFLPAKRHFFTGSMPRALVLASLVLVGCGGAPPGPVCRAITPVARSITVDPVGGVSGWYPQTIYGNKTGCCDGFHYKVTHQNNGVPGTGKDLAGLEVDATAFDENDNEYAMRTIAIPNPTVIARDNRSTPTLRMYELVLDWDDIEARFGLNALPCGHRVTLDLYATQKGAVEGILETLVPRQLQSSVTFKCGTVLCTPPSTGTTTGTGTGTISPAPETGIGPSSEQQEGLALAIEEAEALRISLLEYVELTFGMSIEGSELGWQRGFVRGDINSDGLIDWDDHTELLSVLNDGHLDACACAEASDVFDDGVLDTADLESLTELILLYEDVCQDDDSQVDEDDDDLTCVFPAADEVCGGGQEALATL